MAAAPAFSRMKNKTPVFICRSAFEKRMDLIHDREL